MKIVIVGPPGTGKGSQCIYLREHFPQLCYINHLHLLRDEVQRQTTLGQEIHQLELHGEVVPDELTLKLVTARMKAKDCDKGYILDGLPKTVAQAKKLASSGEAMDAIVKLELSDEKILERISKRWIHKMSGRIYHETFAPPKVPGRDDETGQQLQRHDFTPEQAKVHLETYRNNEATIEAFYHHLDLPDDVRTIPPGHQKTIPGLFSVDGEGTFEEVRLRLFETIERILRRGKPPKPSPVEDRPAPAPWWRFW